MIHFLFGVDLELIWHVFKNKIPVLRKNVLSLLK